MRPFNKTTATLVRPHPFSTLCPTPLGNSPVCLWILKNISPQMCPKLAKLPAVVQWYSSQYGGKW